MAVLPKPVKVEGRTGIEELVTAIEQRRDELGLTSPWSIAELKLDDEDYVRLGIWAESLSSPTVRMWTANDWRWADSPVSPKRGRRACLGLLLLALSAEAARREANEATLWPFVRGGPDGGLRFRADEVLFVQGQPSETFKGALQAAVEEFGLRHVTDQPDTKRYYLTVFLQFGFGLRDARNRLAAWLAGQLPLVAIDMLKDRDGPLVSESFASIWRDLRNGRGRRLPADVLRKRLRACPWVLPGWAEELAELAGRALPSALSSGPSPLDGGLGTILGEPRLTWRHRDETPHFECKIGDLATASLPGREYTLRVDRRVVARIERDGGALEADRDAVVIPGFPAIAAVELSDEESGASEALSIECFDPQEPVSLFDLGFGQPVKAGSRLNPTGRYALVFAEDLTLSPDPDFWRLVRCGALKLRVAALQGDLASGAKLTVGGVAVWEAQALIRPALPSWAWATLEVAGEAAGKSSIPMGDSYRVAIRHSADVLITFVRRGMEPLEPKPAGRGRTLAGPITSAASALARKTKWLIGLDRAGESARVSPEFEPTRHGGAILRGEVWEVLDPANALDAGDARRSPVLIVPPKTWDGRDVPDKDWAVMEGEDWVSRPGLRPVILPNLSGMGGRLTVRLGTFNAVPATPPEGGPKRLDALILADRVVDRGIVRGIYPSEATDDAHAWRIELANEVEIDEGYEVHSWDRSGAVHHLKPRAWPPGEPSRHDWWSVEPPYIATEPRALLVTYHDKRLGAWWSADWAVGLVDVAEANEAGHIADLLLWFKLPVLEERSLPEVRRLAERWPTDILRSWMSKEAPAGWRFAIRAAFRDWRPGPDQFAVLSKALGAAEKVPEGAPALKASALNLMKICPILMGRLLRGQAAGSTLSDMRTFLRWVRAKVEDDLRFEVCDPDLPDETVRDGVARVTHLDLEFLKVLNASGVAAVLDLTRGDEFDQRPNLDLAVTDYPACRLLLALDILQSLEAGELSYWKGGRYGAPQRLEADRVPAR